MPSHHPPPRPTMLPKFADTTTTIIYCVHCRSCSSSSSAASASSSASPCIISDEATETENTNNFLNRCSRCKVVHYCSKECQKLNYQFHKKRCQLIHKLRNEIENMKKKNEDVGTEAEVEMEIEVEVEEASLQKRYELSYLIFELGYMSTDTIERGKYIYQCSLIEYYKLFQIDNFYFTGVLESILLLLSILGDRNYDKYCISLIKYVLYNNDNDNDNNDIYNNSEFLCWDYGDITTSSSTFEISDYKKFRTLLAIRHHNNTKNGMFNPNPNMNPNIFFVPLMIIKMRQYADMTRTRNDHDNQSLLTLKKEIAELCYQIEYETNTNTSDNTGDFSTTEKVLPVMKSLFPDSDQHWGEEEVQMFLARRVTTTMTNDNQNDNEWKNCCFIYWMLIKDCYAYTPGLLDVVEEIIIYMEESKESKEDVIPNDDIIGNNDNDNDPSSESDNDNNLSIHDSDSEEYISFINSMSSTAQEQQHKQQQEEQEEKRL